ncbi:MAG TPA: hypothetical protein VED59_00705, partial [Acidimicrobiales bacterium]|nr:hypothetical protein [Acidimicrobiales bacterium]
LQMLVEFNVGLVSAWFLAVAAVCTARRSRAVAVAASSFAGAALVAWLALGQSLGNLASYWRGAVSVTTGYSSAMGISSGRQAENWYAVVDGLAVLALFGLASRGRPWRDKAAIFLMIAGLSWEAVKEGFVRHDLHDLTFLGLALVVLSLGRVPRLLVPAQAVALAVAGTLACLASGMVPPTLHSPRQDAGALAQEARDLLLAHDWARVEARARAEVLATGDRLRPALVSSLAGLTVAAEPWGDAISFAYPQLHWRPLPVLQAYSAYTTYLDRLDAAFLSSAAAPERILYLVAAIDGRDPFWDPPATVEAMYCHYDQVTVSGGWQVLARVGDRCDTPRLVGKVTARFGEPLAVPSLSGKMVVATFALSSPFLAKAEGVLFKPPEVQLTAWGASRSPLATYRFVPGTAGEVHVLAAPPMLGYSPAFSPPSLSRIEFSGGGWTAGHGVVAVTFYSVNLRPARQ